MYAARCYEAVLQSTQSKAEALDSAGFVMIMMNGALIGRRLQCVRDCKLSRAAAAGAVMLCVV
jgi:hypothetical protein